VTKSQVFLLLLVTVVVVVVVVFRIWCSIIMVHAIKLLNSDLLRAVQLIPIKFPRQRFVSTAKHCKFLSSLITLILRLVQF